ncbi:MAG: hypothetical protein LBF89_10540 [Bacteroidales bacterium]|nr:hypothetical protein [Bacteroidales bacterium]
MSYYHQPEEETVARCPSCGRAMWPSGSFRHSPPVCGDCYNRGIRRATRWGIARELLITFAAGWTVATLVMANHEVVFKEGTFHRTGEYVTMFIIISYCISGIIAGWKTLNRITPAVFLFLPMLGWIIYFAIKLVLAFFVGLVMLPVRTLYCMFRLYKLRR